MDFRNGTLGAMEKTIGEKKWKKQLAVNGLKMRLRQHMKYCENSVRK
jgi:hypothetical protein